MSKVRKPGSRFMNTPDYGPGITQPSKIVRNKDKATDYTKAQTLSSWLFLKYDMSYKTFSRKSKNRQTELRKEFEKDTGRRYISKDKYVDAETYNIAAKKPTM